jgi:hypothetical protein
LGIHEGENVQTNTDSQLKKSLSRKRKSTKRDESISLIISNDWNPFERADPRVLEKVTQEFIKMKNYKYEDALL